MIVKIHGEEYNLHYSFRIYYLFENKIKQADKEAEEAGLPKPDLNSLESTVKLIWAALEATLRYNKSDIIITEDDVLDIIDENGGFNFVNNFSAWFDTTVNSQMALAPNVNDNKTSKGASKKK